MESISSRVLLESLVTRLSVVDFSVPLNISIQMYGDLICEADWGMTSCPSFHRVYYVKGGEGGCLLGGQRVDFEVGKLYMLPVNKEYELFHNPEKPFECMFLDIHISPLVLNSIISYKVIDQSLTKDCLVIIEKMIHLDTIRLDLLMKQLAILIFSIHQEIPLNVMSQPAIVKAIHYIENNYMKAITNEMIAYTIGFNTNYFIKKFHEAIGISPQSYLSKYRLTKSIQMILSDTPIKMVSEQVGYSDVKAFSRFFKRHTGYPPSKYKAERFGKA